MSCLCGDTACPSCGPAQGHDLNHEKAVAACVKALEAAFSTPWEFDCPRAENDPTRGMPIHDSIIKVSGASAARLINSILDDGETEGLVRLAEFIVSREKEAFANGLLSSKQELLPVDVEDAWIPD